MENRTVAGIDVSKHFSDICILAPDNTVFSQMHVVHDLAGMKGCVSELEKAQHTFGHKPVIVMESTAHYHRMLHQFLHNAGFEVLVINPLQSGAIKNVEIRKVKNDKLDAKRLALLYRLNITKSVREDDKTLASLKDMTRQRKGLIEESTLYTNKLTALLDQAFPGYSKVFAKLTCKSSLALLVKIPTPQAILTAGVDTIQAVIGTGSNRGMKSKYAMKKALVLINTAQEAMSIYVQRNSSEILIKMLANILKTIRQSIEVLTDEIFRIAQEQSHIWDQVQLLKTIPGIGEYSAIVILSEIGDFTTFSNPKKLVAFCGLDPSVHQSGTFISTRNKISKRGSPYLRCILDICTHVAVHPNMKRQPANPVLAEYYNMKRVSKAPNVALCACMRKMVTIIYAVMRDQKPFELRSPEEHICMMKRQIRIAA